MVKYKRRDKNTDDIVEAIEECGFEAIDCHNMGGGFPDKIAVKKIGQHWCSVPIEIKGIYGKLTESQNKFEDEFPGLNHVCRTKEDAKAVLRKYERIFNAG